MRRRLGWSGQDDGGVAPTVALSLFALLAVGGIGFDYARMAGMHTELQQAADQAALAAATQLDGETGATVRAIAAAQSLLVNKTRFANDDAASGSSITTGTTVLFYSSKADAEADTGGYTSAASNADKNARYVKVEVGSRAANFALTPIVGALTSGAIDARATAGIGSAICKVPPMMICNPKPGTNFAVNDFIGVGVQVTGHGNDRDGTNDTNSTWAPGDFGFLDVGANNAGLVEALAFQNLALSCYEPTTGQVSTGNPQALYDAINTRFDIYDFSMGGGGKPDNGPVLAGCSAGKCPPAVNVVKDVFKKDTDTNGNSCKITSNDQGWHFLAGSAPSGANFWPREWATGDTSSVRFDTTIAGMGLPRDLCHYTSFNRSCAVANGTSATANATNKYGDGMWARKDYFDTYHNLTRPTDWATMTRYQTYLWEIAGGNTRIPYNTPSSGADRQYGRPVCRPSDTIAAGTDRRVLSVAMVENCADLRGNSRTVVISNYIDMFLVEPTLDGRGNGSMKDSIYMEVIGRTSGTGNGIQSAQTVRRDVAFLVR